ncbi:uncharacterized protein EI90DRAFT_1221015 [Cantharellus anzutake]|uniref:uncharacterized protein n=1 Tax=Cantharellus anzutake TaxID=1750568 RepID=UPI001906864A|nr:uncharacterized protein EI90DRAFT_1221015 [Cantharellus anzutake]KAF8310435.1 hypothetical protein EI90DRAFT_1221015 [Cantharellus anzutake]
MLERRKKKALESGPLRRLIWQIPPEKGKNEIGIDRRNQATACFRLTCMTPHGQSSRKDRSILNRTSRTRTTEWPSIAFNWRCSIWEPLPNGRPIHVLLDFTRKLHASAYLRRPHEALRSRG